MAILKLLITHKFLPPLKNYCLEEIMQCNIWLRVEIIESEISNY